MTVSLEEFHATVKLAKLDVSDAEVETYRHALGAILEYVEQLSGLDVSGVEPMTHAIAEATPLRPDALGEQLSPAEALGSAAKSRDGHFQVPQVTGTESAQK